MSAGGVSATPTGSNEPSTPPGPGVALGDADNGKTLSVAVGEQVTVTLSGGTDWKFTDPKPASVLTPMSAPVVDQANGTVSYQITIIVQ